MPKTAKNSRFSCRGCLFLGLGCLPLRLYATLTLKKVLHHLLRWQQNQGHRHVSGQTEGYWMHLVVCEGCHHAACTPTLDSAVCCPVLCSPLRR